MRTLIFMTAGVLSLLGCTTPQEQARKQQVEMERMIARYGPACTQLGFVANSDPWRNCIIQSATRDDVNRGGVSTSIFGGWGSGGRGSGIGIGIGVGR
ncbi:hypothetical protein [Massilia sp. H6]|uniref:hypothetical protein n=1 Tax=Massilia sp. H6 TaxID=2970464 RepID=UPI002167CD69|nr:hypothetical protein [Massilia sp. H6]UVW29490.1 hypothetical protein NRS07_04995 [Massilia sp. H6]